MNLRINSIIQWTLDISLVSLPVVLTFSRALVEILLVLVLFSWGLLHVIGRSNPFKKNPILLPLLCFWFAGILSLIASKFFRESLGELLNLTEYLLLTLIAFERFMDFKKVNILILVIVYSSFAIGLDGLFQFFLGFDLIRMKEPAEVQDAIRLTASFSHPNNLAAYLAMMIPINLGIFYQKRKWIFLIILMMLLFTIVFTYSRGAWVGLIISLIVFSALKDRKMLIILGLLGLASFFLLPESLIQRAKDIYDFNNVTTQTRFELWTEACRLFSEKPIFGQGLKTFSLLLEKGYAHNCYLQILVEMGVIGLLSFLWILATFFYHLFYRTHSAISLGFGCAILAGAIHCLSDTNLYSIPTATLFWFLLGAGLGINLRQKEISNLTSSNIPLKMQ